VKRPDRGVCDDGERQAPRTRLKTFANGDRELPRAFVLAYCAREVRAGGSATCHWRAMQRAQTFHRGCELTSFCGVRLTGCVQIIQGAQFQLVTCDDLVWYAEGQPEEEDGLAWWGRHLRDSGRTGILLELR